MKKFVSFLLMCLYIVGVIGGIGYTIYCGAYVISVGVLATGYLAWPKAKECFETVTS